MEKFILKSQRNITILDDKALKETIGGSDRRTPYVPPFKRLKILG